MLQCVCDMRSDVLDKELEGWSVESVKLVKSSPMVKDSIENTNKDECLDNTDSGVSETRV